MYGLWLFKELKTEYGYCKIEIFKKSYSGSPIEIEAVEANSLTLSIENLSETISPIGKSVCSFSIVDTGQLSYDDFFTPDATGIKVVISTINEDRGDVAYTTRWSGFVTPDFYSESLVYRTAINISARDNIGYLSDVEFDLVEPSIQIRELFSKAFAKISEQYPMDVMFRSHKTTEDGILLTDAVISTALFKDKTWGEVLELILHDLGLQMRWVDNNTIAVIDLSQIPEYYLPTQFQFINSSGYREILPAWRGLAQKQEFGIRENSFDGNILPQNLNFVEEIEIEPPYPSSLYGKQIKYSIPTNWQTTGDIFTANPSDYNEPFGKRIYFTCANKDDAIVRYMSWRQPITASNSPMKITCKALNTLMIPANKLDPETGYHTGKYLREYIPGTGKISSYWDGDVLQIGIKYNIILHAGLKSYIFKRDWIEIKEDTDLTPNQFILPEIKYTGENMREDPEQPKEEELNIDIVTIPYTGELEFVLYGWEEIERRTYWEKTFGEKYSWDKFFAYIADVTYTFDGDNKATGQEAKTSINPLHNILRNENYQLGNVPKYGGGIGAYAGGLFNLVGEELSSFKRNEDSPAYTLLELVGREIIHFNKKNYNKLSGEIKSPTKEPLKFNSLFSREGKLYYPFSCSLNVIDNTMTITSMQEVEPYTTESFTEIHSEVKSDGGTTVSGGNNTVLQYSEDAGNAKRLYEMQDATPAEKEKAFALVDSPDFPQARRIRVADLIGLDEQALAQYLELNKYLQENDLTPITNRIEAVEGYFTNGSAKDALKLGGIDAGNYWHKGNSGTLDYDWKAKKLNVRTLVIPTSEPTDLSEGEVGFYLGTAGQGAEEPNGSGGLDLTELWAELGSEDYAKKIHISHIPTIQYSSIAGRPSALANPYALTINGVRYDGSEAISLDISAGGGVADAVAWSNVLNKPTTISGYGITDAYTKDGVDLKLNGYLPKSGGTLTNSLAVSAGTISSTRTSTRRAVFYKNASETVDAGTYIVDVSDSGDAVLKMTYNDLTWKNNTVIHTGNIGSQSVNYATTAGSAKASDVYAWAKKSSLAASDVPNLDWSKITSGKPTTLSGYGITDKVAYRETSNNFMHNSNEFTFAAPAYSSYIWMNYRTASGNTDGAITEYRFAKGAGISYADIRAAKYIVNGGTSSQFLKGDGSLDGTSYLPLSGGTITGPLGITASTKPTGNIGFWSASDIGFIMAKSSLQFYKANTQEYFDLIHTGNIGSQSVNYAGSAGDADKLNGLADSYYMVSLYSTSQDINQLPYTINRPYILRVGSNNPNLPNSTRYGNLVHFASAGADTAFQLMSAYNNDLLLYRRGEINAIFSNPWKQIAFTDSNVASATKLQTARTIWGQSFDGTGNVSGVLSDVNKVTFDANKTYGIFRGSTYSAALTTDDIAIFAKKLVLGEDGNVLIGSTRGIGHTNGKLQVYESSKGWGSMIYTNNSLVAAAHAEGYGMLVTSSYNNNGTYLFSVRYNDPLLTGNGLSAFYVKDNGNVLIGSTDDNGYKLQVNGSIHTKGVMLPNYTAIQSKLTDNTTVNVLYISNTNILRLGYSSYDVLLDGLHVGVGAVNTSYKFNINGTLNAGASTLASLAVTNNAKISGEMDANALVIPTAPPTNPQAGKHYLYLA